MNKVLFILVFLLINSINVYAEDIPDSFNVVVPTSLPIHCDGLGNITTSDTAKIINHSTKAVSVKSINIVDINSWKRVAVITNKVGLKQYTLDITLESNIINPTQSSRIIYFSKISPQRYAINQAMANVVFTIDWSSSDLTAANNVEEGTLTNEKTATELEYIHDESGTI